MLSDFVKVKELLSEVVPNFGINQAKVVSVLLAGEVKTARDIADEVQIPINKAYQVLNDLVSKGLVGVASTVPTQYSLNDLVNACQRLVKSRVKELESLPETARQLTLLESSEVDSIRYLVQVKGDKVKVYNQTTKTVGDSFEVKQLRKVLEGLERESARAVYG